MKNIEVTNCYPNLIFCKKSIHRLICEINSLSGSGLCFYNLSLVFLTEEIMSKIHNDFSKNPLPTDVIAFNIDRECYIGEVCISIDHALNIISNNNKINFSKEITLYLIHGWLHLVGYSDYNEKLRKIMRKKEKMIMGELIHRRSIPVFKVYRQDD